MGFWKNFSLGRQNEFNTNGRLVQIKLSSTRPTSRAIQLHRGRAVLLNWSNQPGSIRALRRLAQREECFFQSLADRAVRLAENEHLILVEEIFAEAMKQMQEVP